MTLLLPRPFAQVLFGKSPTLVASLTKPMLALRLEASASTTQTAMHLVSVFTQMGESMTTQTMLV